MSQLLDTRAKLGSYCSIYDTSMVGAEGGVQSRSFGWVVPMPFRAMAMTTVIPWLACHLLNPFKLHTPSWGQSSSLFCPEFSCLFIYASLLSTPERISRAFQCLAESSLLPTRVPPPIFLPQLIDKWYLESLYTDLFYFILFFAKKQVTVFSHIVLGTWLVLLGIHKIIWDTCLKCYLPGLSNIKYFSFLIY